MSVVWRPASLVANNFSLIEDFGLNNLLGKIFNWIMGLEQTFAIRMKQNAVI